MERNRVQCCRLLDLKFLGLVAGGVVFANLLFIETSQAQTVGELEGESSQPLLQPAAAGAEDLLMRRLPIPPSPSTLLTQSIDTLPPEEPLSPPTEPEPAEELPPEGETVAPPVEGATIADIQVQFVDEDGQPTEGTTRPFIITREFNLQPGDAYSQDLAQQGLERVTGLSIVRQATLELEPAEDGQVIMVVNVLESDRFFVVPGLTLAAPTALQGPARPVTVLPLSNRAGGTAGGVRFGLRNIGGNNQTLSLGVEAGENTLGFDLDFRDPWIAGSSSRTGYAINLFNQRGIEPEFDEGDREVDLPNGEDPWVHRLGGGVEFFRPLAPDFVAALGVSYQRVSVRDEAFSSDIAPEDELGNRLTFNEDGQDDLLTLNFSAVRDRRDDRLYPTQGDRIRVGVDQSIPIGESNILFNRLAASYTRFIPLSLFGFTEGPRTLVLNVQGGTFIGDLPPYEAFSLGGAGSVRGYGGGEIGTGRSFLQGTAEYRFPIFGFTAFDEDIDVGGTLFVDYATDLGTGDNVPGEPAEVRDKPGDGLGYGVGLRARTPFGPVRLEFGLNDQGDSEVIFNVGDRF
ncbi:BamA/TamA family outer membrane protein [Leptolyngbya sp. FACHB-541]|uniref:BamA/TamA family outer membrane protein n=1 Tax=Leptolyngbya sp. FACHB-541 TaxID=2692810 RepID=UPI001F55536B|nr:BamA/TamA family outer membrane protein [Leptolyngbya sp. FACHB-541]